jgi:hypothetical protein
MAVSSIITTVNLIVECKSNYENANKMYKNLINLRQEHGEDYIDFLKSNLEQMHNPDYVISNPFDENVTYYYKLAVDTLFDIFRVAKHHIIHKVIHNILDGTTIRRIQNAIHKRSNLL